MTSGAWEIVGVSTIGPNMSRMSLHFDTPLRSTLSASAARSAHSKPSCSPPRAKPVSYA